MYILVTFSQALAFQSLVAQWYINWCLCRGNWGTKKKNNQKLYRTVESKLQSTFGWRCFFLREWWHWEGELPKRELKAALKMSSKSWEAGIPSGSCSPLVSPPGARRGGDGDARGLSEECLVCLAASCWGTVTLPGTELENLEQEGNAAQVLSQP